MPVILQGDVPPYTDSHTMTAALPVYGAANGLLTDLMAGGDNPILLLAGGKMELETIPQLMMQRRVRKVTVVPAEPQNMQSGFLLRVDFMDGGYQFIGRRGRKPLHCATLDEVFRLCQRVGLEWFGVELKPRTAA